MPEMSFTKRYERPTVADLRALKGKRPLTMLYVETLEEAAAAADAEIDVLSIVRWYWNDEMRKAAGNCFVQVALPYSELVTAEDYLRAAHAALVIGADSVYCTSSLATIQTLAADGIPVASHAGLIPTKATWTGGLKAVGKTAESAMQVYQHIKSLENAGAFAAELEVVPELVAREISARTSLITLGMGAGAGTDAQYLFTEDVLGFTRDHKPRHAKTYADFASEYARLQAMRVKAFVAFREDVSSGQYPAKAHSVGIEAVEFETFMRQLEAPAS